MLATSTRWSPTALARPTASKCFRPFNLAHNPTIHHSYQPISSLVKPLDTSAQLKPPDIFHPSSPASPTATSTLKHPTRIEMTDYASLKVPDLKKLLQERGLQQSGNKADLIARLQDNDKSRQNSKTSSCPGSSTPTLLPLSFPQFQRSCPHNVQTDQKPVTPGQAEDVIDWDDDDTKIASAATKKEEPKAAAPAAANAKTDTSAAPAAAPAEAEPAKSVSAPAAEAQSNEAQKQDDTPSAAVEAGTAAQTEEKAAEPSQSFAIGLEASNADEELKKREARAKRFGITTDTNSEEAKKLERAKKFGTDTAAVVKGLDAALPERRPKRGREQGDQAEGGGKRQNSERRNGGQNKSRGGRRSGGGRPNRHEGGGGGGGSKVLADPSEKAKAEARAKRFGGGN